MLRTESFVANINKSERKNDELGIEDQAFPTTFLILKMGGAWIPTKLKLRLSLICYKIYSVFCFIGLITTILTISLEGIIHNSASLVENWYMLVIFFIGLLKITNLKWKRVNIINLLEKFIMDERWSIARNEDEYAIIMKSKRSEKLVTCFWSTLLLINGLNSAINTIVRNNGENSLTVDSYTPCDRSIPSCFWTAYACQSFGYAVCSISHVSFDCLIFNVIERINTHMKLLIDRLQKLPVRVAEKMSEGQNASRYEASLLKESIQDHCRIYESAKQLNNTFYKLVTLQSLTTISMICTNIYFLSRQELFSSDFFTVFASLFCLLVQTFIYCWYGYKLSESSSYVVDAIFSMDWLVLSQRSRSMLLFIMMSASYKIQIFHNALVTLSPETFLQIIKLSYSAFNLLQQSN